VFFTSYMSYLAVVVRIYRVLEGSSSLLCFVFVFYVWEKTQTRRVQAVLAGLQAVPDASLRSAYPVESSPCVFLRTEHFFLALIEQPLVRRS
jgi:hypothetical protein